MLVRRVGVLLGVALLAAAGCGHRRGARQAPMFDPARVVDLSYAFGPDTIYWPTGESFELKRTAYERTPQGYWYASNEMCLPEHGGTHMDAPIHFAEGKRTCEQVPLSSCIGPAVVVDVQAAAATDRDYRLRVEDLLAWEERHGRIPNGAIVILHSGWGRYWGDRLRYLGTDQPNDITHLHFPGFSQEAARFLVAERDIAAVGVDTASMDHGPSQDFIVHQIINGADKPGFENLANVDRLPAHGATLIALPMKITGGSGGPARVIAILP